jgi:hypothetical protein
LNSNKDEVLENFYKVFYKNRSSKDELKCEIHRMTLKDVKDNANFFALFMINSSDSFYYLGGATYNEIGQFVNRELFRTVCMTLISKITNSKDLWFDIQQVGRWVGQDFVPRGNELPREEKVKLMMNNMMDYFESNFNTSLQLNRNR